MSRWYRVFAATASEPAPAALLEQLQSLGLNASARFRGDDLGWFRAELLSEGAETPLHLERYLAGEEDIRAELNSWAAWLETQENNPHHGPLMERMISAAQVFTLHEEEADADNETLGLAVCRFLARVTDGVYQVDGRGFFAADGNLLVPEDA